MIDTHCHIDRFPVPLDLSRECERNSIRVVAVTNLPSHYELALPHLKGFRCVVPSLGIHPLSAADGKRELGRFRKLAPGADYIGEIGLDFSRAGMASKAVQESVFEEVLECVSDRPRFITLHSRGAANSVLAALQRHGIESAVFHWFSGTSSEFDAVLAAGHLVSFNPAMLRSAKALRFLQAAPLNRILAESDGPYAKADGKPCQPKTIAEVYEAAAKTHQVSQAEIVEQMRLNFVRAHGRIVGEPSREHRGVPNEY